MADQDDDTYGSLPGTDLPNVSRNWTQFKDRIYSSGWEGVSTYDQGKGFIR
jgi:hypothetical protein